jgi:cytochrome c556
MEKRTLTGVVLVAVAALFGGAAFAQFAKTEDAVKYRQSAMFLVGQHFTRVGAVVKGEAPHEKDVFANNTALVDTLIKLPWDAFMVTGSDKGSSMKPEALAQKDKFMALAKANQTEVGKLAALARGGDLNAVKAQFGETSKSCKACHDPYRSK